jgi:hypothetical protein
MKDQHNNAEKDKDPDKIEWGRAIGEGFAVLATALLVASAAIIDVVHPITELPWVHKIAELEPTVIALALLTYVALERWKVLGPTKKKVDGIQATCKKLNSIPNFEQLSSMLDGMTAKIVGQLSSKTSLTINDTAEDTYLHILRILDSVEKAKLSEVKTLRHSIFHAEGARDTTPEDDQPYFVEFRQKMKTVSASAGRNRWDVKVLYNITHIDRLNVILNERLDLGTEGYRVRAMCLHDFFPVFSPMIIDDQHVFLAVLEEGKNRVSRSVYMRGEKAARFFADYFDEL